MAALTNESRHPSAGALAARERRLVAKVLRLYRNGDQLDRLEAAIDELRAVRKELQHRRKVAE